MNKIILFDLDGTLIDSKDSIISTFYHAFKEQNFNFLGSEQDIQNLIGYPLDIMFKNLGVEKNKILDFIESYKNRYKNISIEQTTLLENAFEAVVLASKIARLGVVTTKTKRYSLPILENLKIAEYFEVVTGRENVENPKPHPEPILKTLEQMNYKKEDAWMIGDTKLDLISANDAKINCIGVLSGYSNENELKKYTKIVKKNSFEAVKYLESL